MRKFLIGAMGIALLAVAVHADDAADIRARTEARRPVISALVTSGAVVEESDGYLLVKDAAAVGDKAEVVAAENADRKAAYEAIAKATGATPEAVGKRRAERIRAGAGK